MLVQRGTRTCGSAPMQVFVSRFRLFLPVVPLLLVAGCSSSPNEDAISTTAPSSPTTQSESTSVPEAGSIRIALPVAPDSTVEGLVNVDGHDLYARCAGKGSPSIVYFTGWAPDVNKRGVEIARGIENALGPGFRVCSYERRNTGRSDTVAGTQSPEDVIADVDGFLSALDEDGPFLLLGASLRGSRCA